MGCNMAKPGAVTKETTSIPDAGCAVATPITPAKPGPANVSWQAMDVTKAERALLKGQKPCISSPYQAPENLKIHLSCGNVLSENAVGKFNGTDIEDPADQRDGVNQWPR